MLVKLIAYGKDRKNAIDIMKRALDEFVIDGIKTNIGFNKEIMRDEVFVANEHTTSYLQGKRR